MTSMDEATAYRQRGPSWPFWGKLATIDGGTTIHPLADHALDVAVVFRQLVELPSFGGRLAKCAQQSLSPVALDRLAVIAMLHDIGKCNRGFQAKRDPKATRTTGHVIEAAALLTCEAVRRRWPSEWTALLEFMCGWFVDGEDQLASILLAAISHHGRPVSNSDIGAMDERAQAAWWAPGDGLDPMQGVLELVVCAKAVFPKAFDAAALEILIDATAAFQQRFAGLVMLADWIGSDTRFFPFRVADDEDRHTLADHAARRALRVIGLVVPTRRSAPSFQQLFPGYVPTPLQALAGDSLALVAANRIVLVESDTGSGKTEAALAWFIRLHAAGLVDGLYFALPTRVAAREIYDRVRLAVDRAFPDADDRPGPVLLAAPGYVNVDGDRPVLPNPDGRLWEDDATARRAERQWASAHPKRFLAAPVAVGTIDQALLSTLAVKHSLMRSVCLDRHLVVVDEVHASDPYMRQLLDALLAGHIGRGGQAMLLSATLGEASGSRFFGRSMLPLSSAVGRSYPCVETYSGIVAVPSAAAPKCVQVRMTGSLDESCLIDPIAEAIRAGARVLVVCNTVARANALLRAVEASGAVPGQALFSFNGVACPHHGRFARDHREHLDAAISARLGKGSSDGPLLLIGTQTLEQSLDIDADWLVSDLCPMDVLLQRIGRLHRHRRARRPAAFAEPTVLLRVPPGGTLSGHLHSDGSLKAPAGIGTVYVDGRILQRTIDMLINCPTIEIPADNRRLIEGSTHPEALALLGEAWRAHGDHVEGKVIAQTRAALTSVLKAEPFGELHYPDDGGRITTRLGEQNLDLPLAHPVSLPFGIVARSIGIPAHMAPRTVVPDEQIEAEPIPVGFRFRLGERRYRYTRFGLELDDDAQPSG